MVRLQKFLAEAGAASRRASEQIIRAGRVSVNGHALSTGDAAQLSNESTVVIDGGDNAEVIVFDLTA